MSATRRECPRTVVRGMRGVLAQRCWNLSCPIRSMKLNVLPWTSNSWTPARSLCWSIWDLISSLVWSMPYSDLLES